MPRRQRRTVAEHGPHPVEFHVGSRVRLRRKPPGMSQERLAEALDPTHQQIHQNERGFNRIGASWLYQLCHILDVPVGYFFEGPREPLGGRNDSGLCPSISEGGSANLGACHAG